MSYQFLTFDVTDRIATITVNRPDKLNALNDATIAELGVAIDEANARDDVGAVLLTGAGRAFVAGADISELESQSPLEAQRRARAGQVIFRRFETSPKPTIAAINGFALGGGCELAVYSSRRVVAMESYIGLVEVGVGLVPGAGGLTYIARRAAARAQSTSSNDLLPFLTEGFTAAAMAKVGTSAYESRDLDYLLDSDCIVMHKDEVLAVALNEVRAMAFNGYRAPLPARFKVAGRTGIATILGQLVNMRDGGFISAHDFHIAREIATVVCGGDGQFGGAAGDVLLRDKAGRRGAKGVRVFVRSRE